MGTALELKNISKSFGGLKAVDSVSFAVRRGSCFAVLGPNGAGKTTLMKMLFGRCLPDRDASSSIEVLGMDPGSSGPRLRSKLGVVSQDNNLDGDLDVYENLYVYSRFYGMKSPRAKITELIDYMELSDKIYTKINELSGGMKRRLVFARALLSDPGLLILDEPTTGLDPQIRHHIWSKINELKRKGVTVLLTTHYMDEAHKLSDDIMIMNRGKGILSGNSAALLKDNIESHVLEIRSSAPFMTGNFRTERYSGITYVYSDDRASLAGLAASVDSETALIRPTDLEDLFLKITGRTLSGAQ
jgi:lipooligosaccharide transport system ATP-binding protein